MIHIFNAVNELEDQLKKVQSEKIISDYRLHLRMNEAIYIYVLNSKIEDTLMQEKLKINDLLNNQYFEIEYLTDEDKNTNSFYQSIFEFKNKIDFSAGRRRYDTLLDVEERKIQNPCPIITFYSYKGGMGRSTTLATCAMHLAVHHKKKIIIIDCDFEAPGFTNFFLKNSNEEFQQNGIVEYVLDREFDDKENFHTNLEKYTREVEGTGAGEIRIMSAGNLSRSNNNGGKLNKDIHQYIEGLARIDFSYEDYIVKIFQNVISDLHKEFNPDFIFIDSRTGFSDILGVIGYQISDIVVGFFRNDIQSKPGLYFFVERMLESTNSTQPIIVNSIIPSIPSRKRKSIEQFKNSVDEIVKELGREPDENSFFIMPISHNDVLERLGMPDEEISDFIDLITEKSSNDHIQLSETIINLLEDGENIFKQQKPLDTRLINKIENQTNLIKAPTLDEINQWNDDEKVGKTREIKEKILFDVREKLNKLELYGEHIDLKEDFENKRFFYRVCMDEIFNLDKTLILGSKGTGKSYIYNALQIPKIAESLKKRANKTDNYSFLYMIDERNRIFKTNQFGKEEINKLSIKGNFYRNFWLVYTWSVIVSEIKNKFSFQSQTSFDHFIINDSIKIKERIIEIVSDNSKLIEIENELKLIDEYLVSLGNGKKEFLVILYDQLDKIVEPIYWNEWIPALIEFWATKRFNRISGKLFMRKDLFRKLRGLNNKKDLENRAIDIEWKQEELFSYFFKFVFSNNIQDWFWAIMYLYGDYDKQFINQARPKFKNQEQFPLDKYYLEPLVVTFFGRFIENKWMKMGESYNWLFLNLQNADGSISIRPFIDLISLSINYAHDQFLKNDSVYYDLKPILFHRYYTYREVRKKAVDRYFEDLVKETGNEVIEYIFDYILNHSQYQRITLFKEQFSKLLKDVKKEKQLELSIEDLEELLIVNGIVKKDNFGRGDEYKFAYLYKYRLGLKG